MHVYYFPFPLVLTDRLTSFTSVTVDQMDGMSGAVNGDVTSSATELLKHGAGWCIFYLINNRVIQ